MTTATVSCNGHPNDDAGKRAAARAAYRASLDEGTPLTGAALGRRFEMSGRWGLDRVHEVRSSTAPDPAPPEREPLREPAPVPLHEDQPRSWVDTTIIAVVALVAFAASYGHMLHVATLAGEPVWIARAFPITVDGLVFAALRRGPQGRWWLALAVAVSITANVLTHYPDLAHTAGPIVSAWPPLALFGTHRLTHNDRPPPTGET